MSNKTAGRKKPRAKSGDASAIPEQPGPKSELPKSGLQESGSDRPKADPVAKERAKAAKEARKQAAIEAKHRQKGEFGRLSPGSAKKYVGLAKVLGPVAAPYLAQGAAAVRAALDRRRARKLGVPVDELGRFTGRGAALHARIASDQQALRELRSVERSDQERAEVEKFASTAESRLGELTSAVRAAERMPAARRRSVHQAAAAELDRVENDLLRRYGL